MGTIIKASNWKEERTKLQTELENHLQRLEIANQLHRTLYISREIFDVKTQQKALLTLHIEQALRKTQATLFINANMMNKMLARKLRARESIYSAYSIRGSGGNPTYHPDRSIPLFPIFIKNYSSILKPIHLQQFLSFSTQFTSQPSQMKPQKEQ